MAVQVVATKSSLHFYSQKTVDDSVRSTLGIDGDELSSGEDETKRESTVDRGVGTRVWTDADEWSVREHWIVKRIYAEAGSQDWKKVGDPILHIEVGDTLHITCQLTVSSYEDGQISLSSLLAPQTCSQR